MHRRLLAPLSLAAACSSPAATPTDATTGTTGASDEDGTASTGSDSGGALGPDDGTVTFYRDILPLAQQRCIGCHSDGNIAPFSMQRYEDAWPWRDAIAAAVADGSMPPWLPGPDCNDYANDPTLDADTRALVQTWADEDGPRGDPADAPPQMPPAVDALPRVDLSLGAPDPFTPSGTDDYRCFLLDWPQDTPTFVTGFRAVPGNPAIVHHVIAYRITPDRVPVYEALDAEDPEPGYTCFGGPGGDVTDPGAGLWLGAWAPGGHASVYPAGTGLAMSPGSKVVLQVHYNQGTTTGSDTTAIELMIDDSVEREAFMLLWADLDWLGGNMPIPAGDADVEHHWAFDPTVVMDFLTDVIPPDQPFQLHSAAHHMHKLGTTARHRITRGDGTTTCLLDIPRWDFAWQSFYGFAEPVTFQPGDVLELSCHWDNHAGDADVNWGEGTSDEMCLGIYYATPMP